MFINTHILFILGPGLFLVGLLILHFRRKINRLPDKTEKAVATMKLMTIATGGLMVLLWLLLPVTPVLSTFGNPKTAEDIETTEKLFVYLQSYNQALVRTTSVLYWFLFLFVFWFLGALYSFTAILSPNPTSEE